MKYVGWLVACCLWAAYLLKPSPDGVEDKREKAAIRRADSVYVERTDTLRLVRRVTDSILVTDTLISRDTVTRIVEREREVCDAVLSACEQRVATRDQRIATLEKRTGGWLFLYGEAGGGLRNTVTPVLGAEVGAAVRLDRQTMVQAGVTTDRDIRIKVRRQIKLF